MVIGDTNMEHEIHTSVCDPDSEQFFRLCHGLPFRRISNKRAAYSRHTGARWRHDHDPSRKLHLGSKRRPHYKGYYHPGSGPGNNQHHRDGYFSITLTKTVNGPIRVQQLSFTGSGADQMSNFIAIDGPWPSGKPVIFENVTFNAHGNTMMGVLTPGGVIFSHIALLQGGTTGFYK